MFKIKFNFYFVLFTLFFLLLFYSISSFFMDRKNKNEGFQYKRLPSYEEEEYFVRPKTKQINLLENSLIKIGRTE